NCHLPSGKSNLRKTIDGTKFQRAAGGKGKNALQYPGAKKSMFSGRENVSRETLLPVKCLQYVFGSGNGMRKIFS
ncbi:MAG TPA: hypothetical protein PLC88_08520, partial [Syntrophomonas sp.]|nr:hypothetical protein [Syntrophomonas sp.]HRW12434.1 hypothetical protein [Syntrophomonas sp.]